MDYPEFLNWVAYFHKKHKQVDKIEYYLAKLTYMYHVANKFRGNKSIKSFLIGHEEDENTLPSKEERIRKSKLNYAIAKKAMEKSGTVFIKKKE